MIIIMMTVAFLDMNMRTRGTFSKDVYKRQVQKEKEIDLV